MLAGANEIIANSVQEGVGIPVKESNADTLRAIRQVVGMMRGQKVGLQAEAVEHEVRLMKLEMNAILDAVLDAGGGDPARATELGFKHSLIDIPFAASRQCRNEVMVARDIRSKNAGPFCLTLDVLFGDEASYQRVVAAKAITREKMAALYRQPVEKVEVYHHPVALAMKVSIGRPVPAGSIADTDLYGAQQHVLLYPIEIA